MCSSTWTLAPTGVWPPTFMIYEAMLAGSLPLFAYLDASLVREQETARRARFGCKRDALTADVADSLMPFYDEGVRFSEFGKVLFHPDADDVVRAVQETKDVTERRAKLEAVRGYFTPNGTFAYILRRMRSGSTRV